jgi:hypothetical protein
LNQSLSCSWSCSWINVSGGAVKNPAAQLELYYG